MLIQNCKVCGRVFKGDIGICPGCLNDRGKIYTVIREYIEKHPGASKVDVHKDTGISISILNEFIKDGRLHLLDA